MNFSSASTPMRAFIGLGSNIGDGQRQITRALEALDDEPGIRLLRHSSLYRTAAWGDTNQPDFTNAAAELKTRRSPLELLSIMIKVEMDLGRVRTARRWGARTIDLDILLLDDRICCLPGLRVPHPRMHRRAFVLVPLLELEPELIIPGRGRLQLFLDRLDRQGISHVSDEKSKQS